MSNKTTIRKPTPRKKASTSRPVTKGVDAPVTAPRPQKPAAKPGAASTAKKATAATKSSSAAAKPSAKAAPSQKAAAAKPASPVAAVKGAASRVSSLDPSELLARFRVPLIALVAVALVGLALYAPVRGLYVAWRENTALQGTLTEETQITEEYQSEVDALLTEQGIKDEARDKGYVGEGEKSIVSESTPDDDTSEEEAPEEKPWYLSVGDFIFQYSEE